MADNETPKPTMKRPTNCKIVIINDLVGGWVSPRARGREFPPGITEHDRQLLSQKTKGNRTKSRQTCIYLSWVVGMGMEGKANECLMG